MQYDLIDKKYLNKNEITAYIMEDVKDKDFKFYRDKKFFDSENLTVEGS